MADGYPSVVEGWPTRPDAFPPQAALLLLDRCLERTLRRMEGEDRSDPDRWGEAMRDALEAELGEPTPPTPPGLMDPARLASVRAVLLRLVDHYFTTDWEAMPDPNGPP